MTLRNKCHHKHILKKVQLKLKLVMIFNYYFTLLFLLHYFTLLDNILKIFVGKHRISSCIETYKVLGNVFKDSQFNQAPLLWMFCRKTLYSKIEKVHHKTLKFIYKSNDTYDNQLLESNTVSVHKKHLKYLMTEYIKVYHNSTLNLSGPISCIKTYFIV